MRLYTNKKETIILRDAVNQQMRTTHDPEARLILLRLLDRIQICMKLQENEDKGRDEE